MDCIDTLSEAIQTRDPDLIAVPLADDVVFSSPVSHLPYIGKDLAAPALATIIGAFDKITNINQIAGTRRGDYLLIFRGTSLRTEIICCLIAKLNKDKKVDGISLFARPLRAVIHLAEVVGNAMNQQ
ncbi:hypothetical protein [Mycobacteroides abscessus]|uniref:hypothetical protein n=1 Tax=Mycobacteroides abscessus TaxID=36809 RepID=UPI0013001118|nr:hypothetical protein [Mycobacteroides abscessus]